MAAGPKRRIMLMWLSAQLVSFDAGFAVFQYLTLRGFSPHLPRW